jgi:hypothetical protein
MKEREPGMGYEIVLSNGSSEKRKVAQKKSRTLESVEGPQKRARRLAASLAISSKVRSLRSKSKFSFFASSFSFSSI